MKPIKFIFLICSGVVILLTAFIFNKEETKKSYKTQHVIVLVVDGPRYTETWGDSLHQYIPHMAKDMAPKGVVLTKFYNDGYTYTSSGHAAICTGHREPLENKHGNQLPAYPSFLQCYLQKTGKPSSKAWVITSKDKLIMLADCEEEGWKNKYTPSTLCGINGKGTGFAEDNETCNRVLNVLKKDQPDVMVVNFKEPDMSGHEKNWNGYLQGIRDTDSLVWEVWKHIQSDPYYKNTTTLFVTNDHGRHSDGWKSGFVNHGDTCDGCRHINLYAFGPDFKKDVVLNERYLQVDIAPTIAELLGFAMPHSEGKVMKGLFK